MTIIKEYQTYKEIPRNPFENGGAFLTAKTGGTLNTMAIAWGGVTIFWSKPVFIAPIRQSRFTHDLVQKAKEFTVSVPLTPDLKSALTYCGTKSGRDVDKFAGSNLTVIPSRKLQTPVIAQCNLHYECRVIYQHVITPGELNQEVNIEAYHEHKPSFDYHTFYYGQIVDCYMTE